MLKFYRPLNVLCCFLKYKKEEKTIKNRKKEDGKK